MTTLAVTERPIASLKPYARNARTHSKKQIHRSRRRSSEFGFTTRSSSMRRPDHRRPRPRRGRRLLGWTTVPTIWLEHISRAQTAGLHPGRQQARPEWRAGTGDPGDRAQALLDRPRFRHRDHRLRDGRDRSDHRCESRRRRTIRRTALPEDGEQRAAVTRRRRPVAPRSPPAPLRRARDPASLRACCMGRSKAAARLHRPALQRRRSTATSAGSAGPAPRVRHGVRRDDRGRVHGFLRAAFAQPGRGHAVDGAIHFVCMDWRHMARCCGRPAGLRRAQEPLRLEQGQRRHGLLLSLAARTGLRLQGGTAPHINTFELGQHGRYRTNVWDYAGVNTWRAGWPSSRCIRP